MRNNLEEAAVAPVAPLSLRDRARPEGSVQRVLGPACGKRHPFDRIGPRGLVRCGIAVTGGGRESQRNGKWQGPSCLLRLLAGVGAVPPGSPVVEGEDPGRRSRKARARKTFSNHGQNPPNSFVGRFRKSSSLRIMEILLLRDGWIVIRLIIPFQNQLSSFS